MAETRLNKVLRELNISIDRAVEFLNSKGIEIEKRPTTKISEEVYQVLSDEFQTDATKKMASQEVSEAKLKEKEALREQREKEVEERQKVEAKKEEAKKVEADKAEAKKEDVVKARAPLTGPKQVGKIDLKTKAKKTKEDASAESKKVKSEKIDEVDAAEPSKEKAGNVLEINQIVSIASLIASCSSI